MKNVTFDSAIFQTISKYSQAGLVLITILKYLSLSILSSISANQCKSELRLCENI